MRSRKIGATALIALLALVGMAFSVTLVHAAPVEVADGVGAWFQDDDGDDDGVNAFCADPELTHPVAEKLAARYGATYGQVIGWFCDGGMGFGQISLVLRTADLTGEAPEVFLERRAAGEGWGEIWQDVGKPARGRKADTTQPGGGPPSWAGPEDGEGDLEDDEGGGPPPWAGPRDQRDPNAERPGNGRKKPKP